MKDSLDQRVLEAAGEGYLTAEQIAAVRHNIIHELGTRSADEIGIAKLMQLVELARAEGLDEVPGR